MIQKALIAQFEIAVLIYRIINTLQDRCPFSLTGDSTSTSAEVAELQNVIFYSHAEH